MAFGHEKQIAAQSLRDSSYYIAIGLRLPEEWNRQNGNLLEDPSTLRKLLLQHDFVNWPEVHTNLIKYGEGGFRAWPLYAMPTDSLSWKTVPGVTLIGDAAHVR